MGEVTRTIDARSLIVDQKTKIFHEPKCGLIFVAFYYLSTCSHQMRLLALFRHKWIPNHESKNYLSCMVPFGKIWRLKYLLFLLGPQCFVDAYLQTICIHFQYGIYWNTAGLHSKSSQQYHLFEYVIEIHRQHHICCQNL